jgi:hypothetical protein
VLKPILIGFLVGFSLMGASRIASASATPSAPLPAASVSFTGQPGAALSHVALGCPSQARPADFPQRERILI